MQDQTPTNVGKRIREIRNAKGITLQEVAAETSLTPSFISQFERGLTQASIGSINKIANAIGANMSLLFVENDTVSDDNDDTVHIVKKKERRVVEYPGHLRDHLLSHPNRPLEVFYGEISPHGTSEGEYQFFGDEEFILIMEGQLVIEINHKEYVLNEGDTIGFKANNPHHWRNDTDAVTKILWVITNVEVE